MNADRIARNRARAQAALEPGTSSFGSVEAVQRIMNEASRRMDAIAGKARAYRLESDEKLNLIDDRALRGSVDPSTRSRA